jgi:hypothetical protein
LSGYLPLRPFRFLIPMDAGHLRGKLAKIDFADKMDFQIIPAY